MGAVAIFTPDNSFVEVLSAKESLKLARDNLAAFNRIEQVNVERVRAGDLARVELTRTQLAELQFNNAVIQAETRLRIARQRLQLLMGRTVPSPSFDVSGGIRRESLPFSVEELQQQALLRRPDYLAMQRDQARSQAEIRLQLAQRKFDFTFGTEYRRQQGLAGKGNALGFFFSIPLPIFDRNQGEIGRAQEEARQIEARMHALEAEIRNEISAACQQYETARTLLTQIENDIADGATIIARRENQRQITIRTNIRGRDQGGFVGEAQRRFINEVKLPEGYQVTWGGMFENLERARKRLMIILPITIAIIFTLLFSAFGSSNYALLVLMSVPFSLVGGILALLLRNINLSVSAAVGFISLFGVAVMSGVLVVAEINRQRKNYGGNVKRAVIAGALNQMRPVLMMILVAMLGMIPAARATGIGSDVQRPLATVVVGGLLSTLFLTLLALPSLYYLMARHHRGSGDRSAAAGPDHKSIPDEPRQTDGAGHEDVK